MMLFCRPYRTFWSSRVGDDWWDVTKGYIQLTDPQPGESRFSAGRPTPLLCRPLALVRLGYIRRSLHSDNAGRQARPGDLLLPPGSGQLLMLIPILLEASHGRVTAQMCSSRATVALFLSSEFTPVHKRGGGAWILLWGRSWPFLQIMA